MLLCPVGSQNKQMYWVATFMWDILLYSVLSGLIMAIFYLYGGGSTRTFLFSSETAAATFVLLWMYGLGSIPLAYLYSWMFDNPPTAQIGKYANYALDSFMLEMARLFTPF